MKPGQRRERGASTGSNSVCVHVGVPALRLGTRRALPPREAGAPWHCPSGHSGRDRCYLSAAREGSSSSSTSHGHAVRHQHLCLLPSLLLVSPVITSCHARRAPNTRAHMQNSPYYFITVNQADSVSSITPRRGGRSQSLGERLGTTDPRRRGTAQLIKTADAKLPICGKS